MSPRAGAEDDEVVERPLNLLPTKWDGISHGAYGNVYKGIMFNESVAMKQHKTNSNQPVNILFKVVKRKHLSKVGFVVVRVVDFGLANETREWELLENLEKKKALLVAWPHNCAGFAELFARAYVMKFCEYVIQMQFMFTVSPPPLSASQVHPHP